MITREELREELTAYPTRNELRTDLAATRDELKQELAAYPTRNELRTDLAATRDELKQELAAYATRNELRADLAATRDELRQELAAYSTRDELRAEYMSRAELERALARYATRADLNEFREETAQAFGDLRRYMEILIEDLKAWTKTLFDGSNVRVDAVSRSVVTKDLEQDRRLDDLDDRVGRLKSRPRRTPK